MAVPAHFSASTQSSIRFGGDSSTTGMVLIPGGTFERGGDNELALANEFPKHNVTVDGFYMHITEVTDAQFQIFVDATGYITAERRPDWDELKTPDLSTQDSDALRTLKLNKKRLLIFFTSPTEMDLFLNQIETGYQYSLCV
ncbi:SUMF1/EgtB/PvdO family nonheme iron enzyme [Flavisolibacter ginsenosidimutans]|uniref:Formylglycine-generating enzyme family protein n=1 Tax=Flavisolibacter ginsenosidimutans TaxID=661481 RepID=A0A5B8UG00_9BACT|nr:SUMF1/EgtB/PvdO family nonheme iron enzyme [Flavisolibacter ginsenosidimutans]QEC55524.1 formylglycine-generating enzyme family protein [Flavisolibacter ginsenosidimutans]